jgi:hypothetical protein
MSAGARRKDRRFGILCHFPHARTLDYAGIADSCGMRHDGIPAVTIVAGVAAISLFLRVCYFGDLTFVRALPAWP